MMKIIHGRAGKDGKKYWTTVGVAYKNDNGSIGLTLQYVPAAEEGAIKLLLVEDENRQQGAPQRPQKTGRLDDEIPF